MNFLAGKFGNNVYFATNLKTDGKDIPFILR